MDTIVSKKVTLSFTQKNIATPEKVFPLLCPVREKDWLDGWEYKMIWSESGFAEEGCVFSTPHHGKSETTWIVTKYDPINFQIEFVRFTPAENVARIFINLEANGSGSTDAFIKYEYTALNREQIEYLETGLQKDFQSSMHWWEKAINHYLETGEKLLKSEDI